MQLCWRRWPCTLLAAAESLPPQPLPATVELKNSLEARLGLQLPGTLVFDYPTVAALAGYIETQLPEEEGAELGSESDELAYSPLGPRGAAAALPEGTLVALTGLSNRTAQVPTLAGWERGAGWLAELQGAADMQHIVPLQA